MFYDLDADASSSDGGPGGRLKSNRKRITDPAELRALRDNLLPDDLDSAKAIVTVHVEQNDTIMLCLICRSPSKITTCYDCGTADLCALCMFDHGCLQPVCGHCGAGTLTLTRTSQPATLVGDGTFASVAVRHITTRQ